MTANRCLCPYQDLTRSTAMFGRLADQKNALSQVLYGLALRLVSDKPVHLRHPGLMTSGRRS